MYLGEVIKLSLKNYHWLSEFPGAYRLWALKALTEPITCKSLTKVTKPVLNSGLLGCSTAELPSHGFSIVDHNVIVPFGSNFCLSVGLELC